MTDAYFMKQALTRAKAAAKAGEVPIGALVVKDGTVIASGRNMREGKKNALLHAEIVAIGRACKKLGAWRLEGCTLYVTMEPCPMCAGAIINARLSRVVFGCYDPKAGVYGSVMQMRDHPFNHSYEVIGGVLENECVALLREFFAGLRKRNKDRKTNQTI